MKKSDLKVGTVLVLKTDLEDHLDNLRCEDGGSDYLSTCEVKDIQWGNKPKDTVLTVEWDSGDEDTVQATEVLLFKDAQEQVDEVEEELEEVRESIRSNLEEAAELVREASRLAGDVGLHEFQNDDLYDALDEAGLL